MQRENIQDILVALLLAAAIAFLIWPSRGTPGPEPTHPCGWCAEAVEARLSCPCTKS